MERIMKLFLIESSERDWFAANDAAEARRLYMHEYGLTERDMDGVEIAEVTDPASVSVTFCETDAETGESREVTAHDVMAAMTAPGIVCSTAY
jgi:hypothetical protein